MKGIVQPALQWVKANEPFTRNRDLVEVFAGECEITKAAQRLKLNCIAYDKRYKPCTHNILRPKGFYNALRLVCEFRPFGTLWTAPVCSTWICCFHFVTCPPSAPRLVALLGAL